ncbi:hypothetical protein FKM82_024894 [Ascaphus truei]
MLPAFADCKLLSTGKRSPSSELPGSHARGSNYATRQARWEYLRPICTQGAVTAISLQSGGKNNDQQGTFWTISDSLFEPRLCRR